MTWSLLLMHNEGYTADRSIWIRSLPLLTMHLVLQWQLNRLNDYNLWDVFFITHYLSEWVSYLAGIKYNKILSLMIILWARDMLIWSGHLIFFDLKSFQERLGIIHFMANWPRTLSERTEGWLPHIGHNLKTNLSALCLLCTTTTNNIP